MQDSDVETGLALISVPHAIAAITINDNDSRLMEDIIPKLGQLVAMKGQNSKTGKETLTRTSRTQCWEAVFAYW